MPTLLRDQAMAIRSVRMCKVIIVHQRHIDYYGNRCSSRHKRLPSDAYHHKKLGSVPSASWNESGAPWIIRPICFYLVVTYQLSVISYQNLFSPRILRHKTQSEARPDNSNCPRGGGSSVSWDLTWRTKLYCIDAARVVTNSKLVVQL